MCYVLVPTYAGLCVVVEHVAERTETAMTAQRLLTDVAAAAIVELTLVDDYTVQTTSIVRSFMYINYMHGYTCSVLATDMAQHGCVYIMYM